MLQTIITFYQFFSNLVAFDVSRQGTLLLQHFLIQIFRPDPQLIKNVFCGTVVANRWSSLPCLSWQQRPRLRSAASRAQTQ